MKTKRSAIENAIIAAIIIIFIFWGVVCGVVGKAGYDRHLVSMCEEALYE